MWRQAERFGGCNARHPSNFPIDQQERKSITIGPRYPIGIEQALQPSISVGSQRSNPVSGPPVSNLETGVRPIVDGEADPVVVSAVHPLGLIPFGLDSNPYGQLRDIDHTRCLRSIREMWGVWFQPDHANLRPLGFEAPTGPGITTNSSSPAELGEELPANRRCQWVPGASAFGEQGEGSLLQLWRHSKQSGAVYPGSSIIGGKLQWTPEKSQGPVAPTTCGSRDPAQAWHDLAIQQLEAGQEEMAHEIAGNLRVAIGRIDDRSQS